MSGYGLFQSSVLGMQAQTHRLNTISYNIANVSSGGFKRSDIGFQTLLSDTTYEQSDLGGVRSYTQPTNDVQGLITPTARPLDLAIAGGGFFGLQTTLTGSDIFYSRDGSFNIGTVDGQTSSITADDGNTITVSNGYLVDKNGYFVLGSPLAADGTYSTSAAAPMRVDQYAFLSQGQPTTAASVQFNLPSTKEFGGSTESYSLKTYDSNSAQREINLDFLAMQSDNQWRMNVRANNLTSYTLTPASTVSLNAGTAAATGLAYDSEFTFNATNKTIQVSNTGTGVPVSNAFSRYVAGDQITFAGSGSNNGTFTVSNVINNGSTLVVEENLTNENTGGASVTSTSAKALFDPIVFTQKGALSSTGSLTFSAVWDDASTSSFTLDISKMTQYNGDFTIGSTSQDGLGVADLVDISFDKAGQVNGTFSDGTARAIYKIPLYDFTDDNGLYTSNGMLFKQSPDSGDPVAFFADESTRAEFVANAIEVSNVDIGSEFSKMIQTQNAYNMNATTFKTIDEMTTVARDLKA